MKMKKIIAMLLCAVISVSCLSVTVSAKNYAVTKDDAKIFEENDELSEAAAEVGLTVADNGAISINTDALTDLTESEQKQKMNNFVSALGESGVSSTGAISDAIDEGYSGLIDTEILIIATMFDTMQGDLTGALGIIQPFIPLINIVIGVVALLVLALLVLSTVIDLAFIGLPMVREALMAGGEGGDTKPKALTYACWATINEVEGSLGGSGGDSGGKGGYKNAYGTYFKKRMWDYVLLGVCLSFLIFGGFSRFITALLGIGNDLVG